MLDPQMGDVYHDFAMELNAENNKLRAEIERLLAQHEADKAGLLEYEQKVIELTATIHKMRRGIVGPTTYEAEMAREHGPDFNRER